MNLFLKKSMILPCGKVVQTDILQNNNTNKLSVKTNTLSNGLYFVKIAIDNTSVTKKLLINR